MSRGDGASESVAEFVERRLGSETLRSLVGPFLTGVYAGDEAQLGAGPVFPALVEAERKWGSLGVGLIASALAARAEDKASPGTFSHDGGLGAFAVKLAGGLRSAVRLSTRVVSIEGEGDGFEVELSNGETTEVCLLYTSPSPRDKRQSRMPSSA